MDCIERKDRMAVSDVEKGGRKMLIRSQNKISLVKFENIVININNINGKEIICWSQMNPGEDEYISLGHYSTKEKAMKVLDMIQEAYINGHVDYQMPVDSEV